MTAAGGFESQGFGREPVTYRRLWEAATAISWPLLDFGTVDANIQAENHATRAQVSNFKKVVLDAVAEVDNGLTTYDAHRRRREIQIDQFGEAVTTGAKEKRAVGDNCQLPAEFRSAYSKTCNCTSPMNSPCLLGLARISFGVSSMGIPLGRYVPCTVSLQR